LAAPHIRRSPDYTSCVLPNLMPFAQDPAFLRRCLFKLMRGERRAGGYVSPVAHSCSELRTSARLLDNGTRSLLGLTENETCLLLTVFENQLTIYEKNLITSAPAHIH
jgi:hypothetical protein